MDYQLDHLERKFNKKSSNITVICDGLNGPANIGSVFRICEAFAIEQIIFCNSDINLTSNRLLRTARNTHKKVSYKTSEDIVHEIEELKNQDYTIIALEITDKSISLKEFQLDDTKKIVLVVGNEQSGVSEAVLKNINHAVHIEMYGTNSSMNVTQALSIALFSLT